MTHFFVRPTSCLSHVCLTWRLSNVRFVQCVRLSNEDVCLMLHLSYQYLSDLRLSNVIYSNLFNRTFVWFDACLTYICLTYICLTYVCPIGLLYNVLFVQCDVCPMLTFVQCDFSLNNVCPMCPKQLLWDWCLSDLRLSNVTCDKCVYSSNSSHTSGDKRDKQDKQWVLLNGNTDIVITQLMPPNSSRLTSPKLLIQT
jgi:hypothetical protein